MFIVHSLKYCINFERSQNLQIDKSVETLLPVLSLWRQDFLLRSQSFVSKWVPPILLFTCLFPTFPARQSRNFGALELPESCSVLLFNILVVLCIAMRAGVTVRQPLVRTIMLGNARLGN